jgi:branched-chain amino acid transport system substrate-binding protein
MAHGTNLLAPAMPVVMSHNMTFIGLFGLAVNSMFNYPKYFSTFPTGPDLAHSRGRVDARHVAVQVIGKWFQER